MEEEEDGGELGEFPSDSMGRGQDHGLARSLFGSSDGSISQLTQMHEDEDSGHDHSAVQAIEDSEVEDAVREQQTQLEAAFQVFRRAAAHVQKLYATSTGAAAQFAAPAACSVDARGRLAAAIADGAKCTERARRLLEFWKQHPTLAGGAWRREHSDDGPDNALNKAVAQSGARVSVQTGTGTGRRPK